MAEKTLKDIVAGLCGVKAEEIGPSFALDKGGLRGSMKRAVLVAAIRRHLGVECVAAASARLFSDLEASVASAGGSAIARAPAATPPAAESAFPVPAMSGLSCGVDIEPVAALPETADFRAHEFYRAHFTPREMDYCSAQESPRVHFAARWCAKEALRKCDPTFLTVPMGDVELERAASGAVRLLHRGAALPHSVSVSHTDGIAIAMVVLDPPKRAPFVVSLIALLLAVCALLLSFR